MGHRIVALCAPIALHYLMGLINDGGCIDLDCAPYRKEVRYEHQRNPNT